MSGQTRTDVRDLLKRGLLFCGCAAAIAALVWVGGDRSVPALAGQENERSANAGEARKATPRSDRGAPANPFPNRTPAASLEGGREWLNASGEITLRDLKGKVVLLDFWTYCCINCMHVLPDLEYLEEKYANELVVIGVHSAKFENEKDAENIRQAILRYEIKHPVINDADMLIWRKFGVRAWPTLVLIDPEGMFCGYVSGEGHRELLDAAIGKLVVYHQARGTLDRTPVHFDLERFKTEPTPLRFPGKLLVDERNKRLFVSDSNHNRIVVSTLDGRLIDVIGSGAIGRNDGSYEDASFDHPQGMALVGDTLYVADTENHLIRTVDLEAKQVNTLAGTGEQARFGAAGGRLRETRLSSPWDLLYEDGTLYIAMAGPHQIWSHRLNSDVVQIYSGSGREDVSNGGLLEAAYAQPSGMASDENFLYVCDSEGSAIRKIPIKSKRARVTTVVGTSDLPSGRSLFEFGDIDGVGDKARLQHPLGVAYYNNTLWIADSYNHKVKEIDLRKNQVKTLFGDGRPGNGLDPVQFNEPAGLAFADGRLYVADTNNHRIVVLDLRTKNASELKINGLEPPQRQAEQSLAVDPKLFVKVPQQTVAAGDELMFQIELSLPEGFKLNKLAPLTYRLSADGDQDLIAAEQLDTRNDAEARESAVRIRVPLAKTAGKATLDLALNYGYCRDGEGGLCKIGTARWRVPVEVSPEGPQRAVRLKASAG